MFITILINSLNKQISLLYYKEDQFINTESRVAQW